MNNDKKILNMLIKRDKKSDKELENRRKRIKEKIERLENKNYLNKDANEYNCKLLNICLEEKIKENCLSKVGAETVSDSFVLTISNDNLGVGQTTIAGEKPDMSLQQALLYDDFEPALRYLTDVLHLTREDIFENNRKGTVYVGLEEYTEKVIIDGTEVELVSISEETVSILYNRMQQAAFTKSNIIKMLKDITDIFRRYQEMTIDAQKKLYKVIILFLPKSFAYESLYPININLDMYSGKVSWNRNTNDKSYVFKDVYAEIQESVVDYVVEVLQNYMKISYNMSNERYEELTSFIGVGPIKELFLVKLLYVKLVSTHAKNLKAINESICPNDKKTLQYLIARENKRFNKQLEGPSILVEQLLDGYTDHQAFAILELLAAKGFNGKINKNFKNQLHMTLCKKFYHNDMIKNSDIKVMGYPIAVDNGLEVGKTYHFINGMCDGSLLDFGKEIYYANGNFEIIEDRYTNSNKKYAVQDIPYVKTADFSKRCFIIRKKDYDKEVLEETLKTGTTVMVNYDGNVSVDDLSIIKVPLYTNEDNSGKSYDTLVGVKGVLDSIDIIEDKEYGDIIIFTLSDIVKVEEEESVLPDVDFDCDDDNDLNELIVISENDDNLFEDFGDTNEEIDEVAIDKFNSLSKEEQFDLELEDLRKKYL